MEIERKKVFIEEGLVNRIEMSDKGWKMPTGSGNMEAGH